MCSPDVLQTNDDCPGTAGLAGAVSVRYETAGRNCFVNHDRKFAPSIQPELLIIESVDSICRDSADTQYVPIQTLISCYNTLPFIFECCHDEQHTQWR